MAYRIGDYRFKNRNEYRAARRDMEIICSLQTDGSSIEEIYSSYLRQITDRNIFFGSDIGRDFLDEISEHAGNGLYGRKAEGTDVGESDRSGDGTAVSFSDGAGKIREIYVVSERKRKIKWFLMTTLSLFLVLSIALFAGWLYRDYVSREKLRGIKDTMESSRDAVTVADNEASADNTQSVSSVSVQGTSDVETEEEPVSREVLSGFTELLEKNKDIAGWLQIPGTDIDYPVMYREGDNDFYLSHDFDCENDVNGLLVLDKRCDPFGDDRNLLIHGHNMRSGLMFGGLKKYTDQEYWREHPVITYSSLYEKKDYEIFSVFRSTVYEEDTGDFRFFDYIQIDDEQQFYGYVTGAMQQSLYSTGVEVSWGDSLITLSTCDYSRENGRLVVVARNKE